MVDQKVLIESLRLASRIDELHQQLAECRRDARVWEVEYQAKEDELNDFADTASAEKAQIQLALEDACAQRDEYRNKLAKFNGDDVDAGMLVSAGSLVGPARSVHAEISQAIRLLDRSEGDLVVLSLSRALAHSESVLDLLSHGGQ